MSEPVVSRWLRARHPVDRGLAAALLVVASPLIAGLAIWVRLSDRGPGFARVPRVGRGGVEFGMWKIRTMHAATPGGLAAGAALTAGDDERITSVGRRLRRRRLDELPQLWNVVRGEMALIGPRPEAPSYVDIDDGRWQRVLCAPPGIAGVTQVLVNRWESQLVGADIAEEYATTVLPVKLAVDEWYVSNAAPSTDWRVVSALISGRGERLRSIVERAVPSAREIPDD